MTSDSRLLLKGSLNMCVHQLSQSSHSFRSRILSENIVLVVVVFNQHTLGFLAFSVSFIDQYILLFYNSDLF